MKHDELTSAIRDVLLKDWDPCNVGSNESLRDEYDEYLPQIASLVSEQTDPSVIGDELREIEKQLGVDLPKQQRERAVELLVAISRQGK